MIDARSFVVVGALFAFAAVVAGCAATPATRIERNPALSLAEARSFAWYDPIGTDRAGYESFVTGRLKRAVSAALERKGLRYAADDADVLVNFYVNLEQRQEVRQVLTSPRSVSAAPWNTSYFGYRYGLYDPWPTYEFETTEYQQGTLTIDLLDTASGRLAWSGAMEGRVQPRTLEEEQDVLRKALDQLFARFP